MRSIIRWKYVLPRLSVLVVVLGLLWLCLDSLLRFGIIYAGQSALGSKVEIGHVDTELTRGRFEIGEVVVAHPDSAMKNLFTAEQMEFDLEVGMALRRKLVIREGRIHGLKFHTDRTTSGKLEAKDEEDPDDDESGRGVGVVAKRLGKRGEAWLDDSIGKLEDEVENELHSVQLANELKERWPAEYDRLAQQAKQIERDARDLRDLAKLIADDPLKHLNQVQPALAGVERLRRQAVDAKRQFQSLSQQMQRDRQAIEEAKRHDIQYVRERLRLDALDGRSLSEYLLGPIWSQRVETAMTWIQRSREMMGEKAEAKRREKARGVNVLFPGIPASADVLVRKLELSGDGTVDGKPYSFGGAIFDITHQPLRHAEPTTLQLRAEGAIEMIARGMLDRRAEIPIDQFVVEFPAVTQHGQTLGDPEKLAVDLAPGVARITADIQVADNDLSGTIRLEQNDLKLVTRLPPKYAKHVSPENVQAALAGMNRLEAVVTLSGKLKRPEYQLESNLGPQLSEGLRVAVQQELTAKQQQLVERANVEINDELNALQSDLVAKHGNLLEKLELGDEQLDQIKRQLGAKIGVPDDLLGRARKLFK